MLCGKPAPECDDLCRPVTQEEKDADPKAEENNNNKHTAHLKVGLAKLKVRCSCCRLFAEQCWDCAPRLPPAWSAAA